MLLLSIITPFHNSRYKSERLLETFGKINDSQVELILIDDGSIDETHACLQQFQKTALCRTIIAVQENKGPGGARNHGLSLASGKYVWFVDSDDDIYLEAIDQLKIHADKNYDFIDFDLQTKFGRVNSMSIGPGEYVGAKVTRELLLENFGRIWTKIIRREIITTNRIFYPEYCIYEDNPLAFMYPFHISSFYKTNLLGYFHHEEFESITRSKPGPRFFDRIATVAHGAQIGLHLANGEKERKCIESKFVQIFLINTIPALLKRADFTGIIQAARVMKYYRESSGLLKIGISPFELPLLQKKRKLSFIYKLIFRSVWLASYFLPSQEDFFVKKHLACWGRPIKYFN